jgi:hypothetical protein
MDFENFMGFLPLLIFVITVVIDKSNRKKRRNRTGHFPPLPDMDSSRESRETYDVTGTQQSQKESTDKTVYKEEAPASVRESKKPWYVEFPEDREVKQRGKVFEQPKVQPTYKVYNEPAFITQPSLKKRPAAPVFAMPRTQKKAALFNGKINRRRLREGIIIAEILDKPRALRPYKEPY